jgi:ABC-type Fe3+ transport system permease subunit
MFWRTAVALLIVLSLMACHFITVMLAVRVRRASKEGTCPGVEDAWMVWPSLVASSIEIFVTAVLVLGGFVVVFQHSMSRRHYASFEDRGNLLIETVSNSMAQTQGTLDAPTVESVLLQRIQSN